jgi:octaprenyl-diphosphate synthase
VLERKTAYLFSASCEIGAILGAADEEQQAALRDYGLNVGTAFQLIDDLLDFTANEAQLGKAAGVDLLGGKVTLPLIYLMQAEPVQRDLVASVMTSGNYGEAAQQELLEALERTGSLARARQSANQYAENARTALSRLPVSEYSESLRALPTYVLERDR